MPPTLHTDGDRCTGDHGNAPKCTWHEGQWTREDALRPCPYDQSN